MHSSMPAIEGLNNQQPQIISAVCNIPAVKGRVSHTCAHTQACTQHSPSASLGAASCSLQGRRSSSLLTIPFGHWAWAGMTPEWGAVWRRCGAQEWETTEIERGSWEHVRKQNEHKRGKGLRGKINEENKLWGERHYKASRSYIWTWWEISKKIQKPIHQNYHLRKRDLGTIATISPAPSMKTASSEVSESLTTGFNQPRMLLLSSFLFPCTIQANTWVVAKASQLIDIAHPWEVLPLFGEFKLVFPLLSHIWTSQKKKIYFNFWAFRLPNKSFKAHGTTLAILVCNSLSASSTSTKLLFPG